MKTDHILTGTKKIRYNKLSVPWSWTMVNSRVLIIAREYGTCAIQYFGNNGWCDWRTVSLRPGKNVIHIPFHLGRLNTRWRIPIKESA